jgi:flagellar FliL protein
MADKKEKDEEGKEEAPKKSKKMLFIIVGVVVLVLIGAGAFFMMSGGKKAAEGEGEEGAEEAEAPAEGHGEGGKEGGHGGGALSGSIVPLDTFIVNLQVKGSFLKTTIQLEFGEPGQPHTLESDMPKVRDAVIRIMSGKTAQEILSVEGKEKLREEVKDGVNNAMGSEDVVNVYFTEFIVQ